MDEPALPSGYSWREPCMTDSSALAALAQVSTTQDDEAAVRWLSEDATLLHSEETPVPRIVVCAADGSLVAAGRVTSGPHAPQAYRATLDGVVHPAHRHQGLGTALLAELEKHGRQALHSLPDKRERELRIDRNNVPQDAQALYERTGFAMNFAEDIMNYALDGAIPNLPLPAGITLQPWSEERIPMFYAAYADAFRERPGFPNWTQEQWVDWVAGSDEFAADGAAVAVVDGTAAGFIVLDVDAPQVAERAGWIVQVGVVPAWRGRGLGGALIAHALRYLQECDLPRARLYVNADNPHARQVYEQVGFSTLLRRSVYVKSVHS